MQSIIWAFCSMLVLMLIISFLPLGFTIKGKFFVILTSFILALGGIAAIASFPLWETAIMLVLLIFFAAYFMDKRIGAQLYKVIPTFEGKLPGELDFHVTNSKIDMMEDNDSIELTELNLIEAPMVDSIQPFVKPAIEQLSDNNEDISFLLERNSENEVTEQKVMESDHEIGYLSDIESLLDEEVSKMDDQKKSNWLEEIDELPSLDDVEKLHVENVPGEIELLEDSPFDFLIAAKDAAVDKEIETEKTVTLQK
ncbi:hypothetical protein ACFVSW_11535 [Neobacillus sp. NPDC058068]|uniref:hypothetical protein n=1 Tax=Neobacillus sp. NPDC058068 TaxID=3346325 RepID=UPI0036DF7E8D